MSPSSSLTCSSLEAALLSSRYRRGHPIYGAAFQLLRCGLDSTGRTESVCAIAARASSPNAASISGVIGPRILTIAVTPSPASTATWRILLRALILDCTL
jgi:hypothetical protein